MGGNSTHNYVHHTQGTKLIEIGTVRRRNATSLLSTEVATTEASGCRI